MTDDQKDEYASRLADQAVGVLGNPEDAAAVLFQAGAAALLGRYPTDHVLGVIAALCDGLAEGIISLWGPGERRQ